MPLDPVNFGPLQKIVVNGTLHPRNRRDREACISQHTTIPEATWPCWREELHVLYSMTFNRRNDILSLLRGMMPRAQKNQPDPNMGKKKNCNPI